MKPDRDDQRLPLTKDETRQVVKEAIMEWLDSQFSQFGRISLKGILSLAFAALLYFWLTTHGLKLP